MVKNYIVIDNENNQLFYEFIRGGKESMEKVIVKDNIYNYWTLKKIRYYLIPPKMKLIYLGIIMIAFIFMIVSMLMKNNDMAVYSGSIFITISVIFYVCTKQLIKKIENMIKEEKGKSYMTFDLIFDHEGIMKIGEDNQIDKKIEYKDIKEVIETKDIIICFSYYQYIVFFEKRNISKNDLDTVKTLLSQRNISWKKTICNIF